jgi:hypothetical protein
MREADVGSQSANTIKLGFMLRFCAARRWCAACEWRAMLAFICCPTLYFVPILATPAILENGVTCCAARGAVANIHRDT